MNYEGYKIYVNDYIELDNPEYVNKLRSALEKTFTGAEVYLKVKVGDGLPAYVIVPPECHIDTIDIVRTIVSIIEQVFRDVIVGD